ncbi:MAG: potassium channel family protein [Acidimicrobiales bacterium]
MQQAPVSARRARRISQRFKRAAIVSGLVLIVAPLLMYLAENGTNEAVGGIGSAYVWLARTLFENTSPIKMGTALGFVAYYIVRIAGYGLVAFATGSLASRFVSTVILRGAGMGTFKGSGHVVICGWNSHGTEILRELLGKHAMEKGNVVLLAQMATDPYPDDDRVTFIRGNPTTTDDLRRAGVERAACAIIVADATATGSATEDLDARTLVTVLAIESLNPACYTCVEVVKKENRGHFRRAKADELVVTAEMTGALLASSATVHGLSYLMSDLLTHPEGQEFHRVAVPPSMVGKTVQEVVGTLKSQYNALFVGVFGPEGTAPAVNPSGDRKLAAGDALLVIAEAPPVLA